MTTRVAVVGAGAAGLSQLAQLVSAFSRAGTPEVDVVCYEARGGVGGTWNTDPHPAPFLQSSVREGDAEHTFVYPPAGHAPTPMYDQLRTNLPHDLMAFRNFPFPNGTSLFPDSQTVLSYLESYATSLGLTQHIRFNTRVERVARTPGASGRRWTVESVDAAGARETETFDYVSVANGHYSDSWIPPIEGLGTFPGTLLHSRTYRRPEDYAGQTVLVVGSFASGSDVARQLALLNVAGERGAGGATPNGQGPSRTPAAQTPGAPSHPYTTVYQSCSAPEATARAMAGTPHAAHIRVVPLISHVCAPSAVRPRGTVVLADGTEIDDVTTIVFATGYNFAFPFLKADDGWGPLVDSVIRPQERACGNEWEVGGVKGLGMEGLDELLLFRKDDRTVAFPALPYQVVPFPLAEMQARLVSLLWAGLLPSFPAHPRLPPNPNNPYCGSSDPDAAGGATDAPAPAADTDAHADPGAVTGTRTDTDTAAPPAAAPRTVFRQRKQLVFVAPYEWTYTSYLMSLTAEAEAASAACWRHVEDWRRARRADSALRARTLGY
ncbi:monooxygenase [Cryptotrichosporon argae]